MNEESIKRISGEMNRLGLRPSELARQVGITPAAMNKILSGETKELKASTLYKLAAAFGRDMEWIHTGKGAKKEAPRLLTWSEAFEAKEDFEVTVTDDAMFPSCLPGDVVTISPSEKAETGMMVAVLIGQNTPQIRMLKTLGSTEFLEATNNSYPEKFRFQEINDSITILGRVTKLTRHF